MDAELEELKKITTRFVKVSKEDGKKTNVLVWLIGGQYCSEDELMNKKLRRVDLEIGCSHQIFAREDVPSARIIFFEKLSLKEAQETINILHDNRSDSIICICDGKFEVWD
jgi:hypothetical protein